MEFMETVGIIAILGVIVFVVASVIKNNEEAKQYYKQLLKESGLKGEFDAFVEKVRLCGNYYSDYKFLKKFFSEGNRENEALKRREQNLIQKAKFEKEELTRTVLSRRFAYDYDDFLFSLFSPLAVLSNGKWELKNDYKIIEGAYLVRKLIKEKKLSSIEEAEKIIKELMENRCLYETKDTYEDYYTLGSTLTFDAKVISESDNDLDSWIKKNGQSMTREELINDIKKPHTEDKKEINIDDYYVGSADKYGMFYFAEDWDRAKKDENGVYYSSDKRRLFQVPYKMKGSFQIEQGILYICEKAFEYCKDITEITIPNSVRRIGPNAFIGCKKLTKIIIPSSVVEICSEAFKDCSSLKQVIILSSNIEFGDNPFAGCFGLDIICASGDYIIKDGAIYNKDTTKLISYIGTNQSFEIPDSVAEIGSMSFEGCSKIKQIKIPSGVVVIGYSTFKGCTSLERINIPDGLTEIKSSAFEGCSKLQSIIIPESVTQVGEAVFADCSSLQSIQLPQNITTIKKRFFSHCSSLSQIKMSEKVSSIEDHAFSSCSSISSFTIPESVTVIKSGTFMNCSSLKQVVLHDNIKEIDSWSFNECISLEKIIIPKGTKGKFGLLLSEYKKQLVEDDAKIMDLPNTHNGHEYVDLGLSVKWATCNVGSNVPEEFGVSYGWGELERKYLYCDEDYRFYEYDYDKNDGSFTITKYSNSSTDKKVRKKVLEKKDDVAFVQWGDIWRIPTAKEFQELIDKCLWEWACINDIWGYVVSSKNEANNNKIFLPVRETKSKYERYDRDYWSRSLSEEDTRACALKLRESGNVIERVSRYCPCLIRPVCP